MSKKQKTKTRKIDDKPVLITVPSNEICETANFEPVASPQKGDAKSGAGNKIHVPAVRKKTSKDAEERKQARKDFGRGVKYITRYLGRYWPALMAAIIVTIGAAVLMIMAPTWMQRVTDVIVDAVMVQQFGYYMAGVDLPVRVLMTHVARYGSMFIILIGANAVLDYIQTFIMVRINNKVAMDLRGKISKKINTVPLSYYDKNKIGDVLSRATNDVDRIGEALTFSVTPLLSNLVLIVGAISMMFWHSWVLALAALSIIPLALIIMGAVVVFSQRYFKQQADFLGEMNALVEENFSGQTVVKAFNGQEESERDFKKINKKHYKASFGVQSFQGIMMPAMTFVGMAGLAAVSIVGGILFTRPVYDPLHVSIGLIMAFILYVGLFQQAIGAIGESFGGVQAAAAASCRVFDFLNEPDQEDESRKVCALTEELEWCFKTHGCLRVLLEKISSIR
ncbi:MAG: ABC transporter ATP-binding protein [Firmicutes bacterium]|nr:ABC transporter ATP-binding protein [Bacillota bacterium]